jgi:hypothetical protein
LLLFSHDPRELLAICAELAYDPLPDFYSTADGFLLIVDTPTIRTFPNTLRLRGESEFLFVPVNADLAPQLQSDEAEALVRDRGLVILPGGRCLSFDRNSPLETTQLLSVERVGREGWGPMPQPRQLADAIRSIRLELPFDDVESALGPGGEGIGSEDPRPAGAGVGKTAANQARMTLGQMLNALGKALGIGKLRRAGERMIERAVEAVPRLGEKVFGNQEAALRDLLKKFREGRRHVVSGPRGRRRPASGAQSALFPGQYPGRRRRRTRQHLVRP